MMRPRRIDHKMKNVGITNLHLSYFMVYLSTMHHLAIKDEKLNYVLFETQIQNDKKCSVSHKFSSTSLNLMEVRNDFRV